MLNTTPTSANEMPLTFPLDTDHELSAGQNTILVVEDEAFVREAACDLLERQGYRVLRARDAGEAQTAFRLQRGSVQLLISDVVLPGQNGPALAKALQDAHPTLKAIFISGYPENTVARHGVAIGLTSYLSKPFSAESLLEKVRQALEPEKPEHFHRMG